MSWMLSLAVLVAAIDQAAKLLIVRLLDPLDTRVVIPGLFNLVHWRNTGGAWGMFPDSNLVLTVVGVLCILGVLIFRHSLRLTHRASALALGLIAGGIAGNTIDRLRLGAVIDFLDVRLGSYHWPAFNVADSAICIGVILYIIVSGREGRAQSQTAPV